MPIIPVILGAALLVMVLPRIAGVIKRGVTVLVVAAAVLGFYYWHNQDAGAAVVSLIDGVIFVVNWLATKFETIFNAVIEYTN